MKYITSISKAELGIGLADADQALKPAHRLAVIQMVMKQAQATGWSIRNVDSYEEFSDSDRSAGRVVLDVKQ